MIGAAKANAARGLNVFPLKNGTKIPALKGWQAKATTDPDQIEAWWTKWPYANVGIHCTGLLVLDVDVRPDRDGRASLRELTAEFGPLPRTYEVTTPSGGQHYYFRLPDGAPPVNNRIGFRPGLDIKTAGGLVAGAGSWKAGQPPVDYYTVLNDAEIADAPEWLVYLVASTPEAGGETAQDVPTDIDTDRAAELAGERLTKRDPTAGSFTTACLVRDLGVLEEDAAEVMADWNDRRAKPKTPEELREKIAHAYRYAQNAAGTQSIEAWFDDIGQREEGGNVPPEMGQKGGNLAHWSVDDLDADSILVNNYTVKGWLPGQALALLFGAPGAGKTFLSLDLAAHVTAGQPWFGQRVRQGGALLFAYEGRVSLQRRVYALKEHYPDFDLSGLWVAPMSEQLSQDGGWAAVTETLKDYRAATGTYPRLIVIDPLADAAGFTDDDQELVGTVIHRARAMAEKTGATVLITHHPGRQDTHRARGTSIIDGAMDTIIRADGVPGALTAVKQRDDACREAHYRLEVIALGFDADGDPVETCIVEQLDAGAGIDTRLTPAEESVIKSLRAMPDGFNQSDAKAMMPPDWNEATRRMTFNSLKTKGYLVSEDGSKTKFRIADETTDHGFDNTEDSGD